MKSTREIFKSNLSLLEEPEVIELLEYCGDLETEIIEFKFEKSNSKELAMIDMLQEVIKGCSDLEKEQMEHDRFGYEAPQYQKAILSLKNIFWTAAERRKSGFKMRDANLNVRTEFFFNAKTQA